jgi:feruloyl esterase
MGNSYGFSGPIPGFCRIAATFNPSSASSLKMEVWLPTAGWNGKYAGTGPQGISRNVVSFAGLAKGFAFASASDLGPGTDLVGNPDRMDDFSYRAVHTWTVIAKQIIKAYYGSEPRHSYWFGLSAGGFEGIMEAARYPKDYDGIAAGWPPNPMALFNAAQMYPDWLIAKNPDMFIPHEKYTMIHQAALDACDALDGVKDGIITEPQYCKFDPGTLLCKGADAPNCLTAPQVEFLKMVYKGPTNPRTGEVYYPGPAPGEELEELWSFASGPTSTRAVGQNVFRMVYKDVPNWDWKTVTYDGDVEKALAVSKEFSVYPEDLKAFGTSGSKLMIYIGWENYHNPAQLIGFYNDAVKVMGEANAAKSFRLVTMPGTFQQMPPIFDALSAIDDWVEKCKAPEQLLGTYTDQSGKPALTRPVCAYPKVPRYKGTGDTSKAENFYCGESMFAKK